MISSQPRRCAQALLALCLWGSGCVPTLTDPAREADSHLPERFSLAEVVSATSPRAADDGSLPESSAQLKPGEFFPDPALRALIESALQHNQELSIASLEVLISRFEVGEREGEYLPKAHLRAGGAALRPGQDDAEFEHYSNGADYALGLFASWELDIWKKLRNARDAAAKRYLASLAGKRFFVTNLVSEVAHSYYELLALDSQLSVLAENIRIQQRALEIVRLEKQAGRVSELAVKRFEAEVFKNRSRRYVILQRISETENRLNLLAGRFPRRVERRAGGFLDLRPRAIEAGLPAELLTHRPDIQRAELALQASKLDVEVARASFYPALELNAGVAITRAFEFADAPSNPISFAYHLAAELTQPLWNRRALAAKYRAANAMQMQAVVRYEQAILRAYVEVRNNLAKVGNMARSYDLRAEEVTRLRQSIEISANLFRSARADYMEVLLTRRDALNAEMELIETKAEQLEAVVALYRALGGGWR